ncbi:tRNA (adenosine(37)-N6)-threonylcarbamoyltransferase complex dimerization subunit type 1 TsaB [Limosilactobacillus fastidiosus]|uniref:tRNA (Adenosine(37)-N6)-threonylcarbamoyltransferase complex dimerization subunit type 1 TsaB n=1 Tax=Limosilactobacillus fastidiosus TaxID=2759855 RepID=A0A7W3TZF9_9LACO|nr:tRNA (adenosine(37)-N6)-threonylcarbamoyltransferase complex dimerization subunit type 1 TsaB [Limosilactobacillus fastidiosus]MBB1062946.1 tRNA (adenosine(37)-N6)-threonylcarbamoyltransferase complex dimerization subunit type 1 TsaB [Limosilactobacillus fastidiosus]MBB1086143.1 tRNA (adenosine(37)-N6)-threonylcarbamoyltransferase complex dimerization subunit type 1 TsaB [Limosilactobacillus fastidiosus]MCD7083792.1 tRNA (adenosine(37)-N6)-threonylcarbamoyltransferase complex dimerization sub
MKILAIDTSNHPMSVAVVENDQLLATETLNMVRNHSIYLMPVIDKLVKLVKWQPEDIDRIVVAQGPGSYTGIRIAVSTAKVLADTMNKELVGVSSLEVLARNIVPTTKEVIVPFFDARRGNIFAGAYQWQAGKLVNRIADQHLAMKDLLAQLANLDQPILLVGHLTDRIAKVMGEMPANVQLAPRPFSIPSTYQLALAGKDIQPVTDIDSMVPHYLRITEAEANWQKLHPGEIRQNYVREV